MAGRRLIPCVFITNHVFQQISEPELEALVQNTARALSNVGAQFPTADFKEYQFDCDWTAGTRAAFFRFLKKIRPLLPPGCRISATIRLHQYKFPDRTGLPPVDRGMLMLYNTGDIDDPLGGNSIFQAADAEKYLNGAPANFPLPLDLALPIFSWALVYRDGALWKIIPEPDLTELQDTSRFQLQTPNSKLQTPNSKLQTPNSKLQTPNSKLQTPNFKLQTPNFKLLQSTYLGGHYLRPGDWLRLETVDTALLRQAARLAARADLAPDARLAFFHLDTAAMRRYPPIFLKSVCETIEK
ncbi:MAG: hypothetical protein JNK89_09120 [Saprospiraceae bacterium]|nr:hypothetical protein [Saprospiraceae bacterium]